MKILKYMCLSMFSMTPILSHATLKGTLDAIYIEDGDWKVAGWACKVGSTVNPTVKFYTGSGYSTYIGSVTVGEDSEPEINASGVCNNTGDDYRFEWTIPSGNLATVNSYPVKATATYPGETDTEITQSRDLALPVGYSSGGPYWDIAAASKIIWFGAHPDDEINVAPIFGDLCFNTATCYIALTTHGGTSDPRKTEMDNSAAALNATVVAHETWQVLTPNPSLATVKSAWESDYGGDVADWVDDILDTYTPDIILTYDPRHGGTCHPEHRAIAEYVVDAVDSHASYSRSDVILVNSLGRYETGPTPHAELAFWAHPSMFDPSHTNNKAFSYSADSHPYRDPAIGKGSFPSWAVPDTGWGWVMRVAAQHVSQFRVNYEQRWVQPLFPYGGATVGNDVTGRLITLQNLDNYADLQTPFAKENSSDPHYPDIIFNTLGSQCH